MTEFYFIRHGQTEGNALGLKQGTMISNITLLNETGKKNRRSIYTTTLTFSSLIS